MLAQMSRRPGTFGLLSATVCQHLDYGTRRTAESNDDTNATCPQSVRGTVVKGHCAGAAEVRERPRKLQARMGVNRQRGPIGDSTPRSTQGAWPRGFYCAQRGFAT